MLYFKNILLINYNIKHYSFFKLFFNKKINFQKDIIIFWGLGMGIGDWGLGIGDWGLGPIPNPQSPNPKPPSPIPHPHLNKNKFSKNLI